MSSSEPVPYHDSLSGNHFSASGIGGAIYGQAGGQSIDSSKGGNAISMNGGSRRRSATKKIHKILKRRKSRKHSASRRKSRSHRRKRVKVILPVIA
jgi:hypothetical protein